MQKISKIVVSFALSVMLMLNYGCATINADGSPLTTEQKIFRCVGSAAAAIAICLALKGKKEECLLAGGATCAIWLAYNNHKDKERIAAARQRALDSGVVQEEEWRGDDGKMRKVRVTPGAEFQLQNARASGILCRPTTVEASVAGMDGIASSQETICRSPDGRWMPQSQLEA